MAATLTEEGIAYVGACWGRTISAPRALRRAALSGQHPLRHLPLPPRQGLHRRNSEVIIVDEFTGASHGRSPLQRGLHQAIGPREGVQVPEESMTLATITFLPELLPACSINWPARPVRPRPGEEFQRINLDVVAIPTYKPVIP